MRQNNMLVRFLGLSAMILIISSSANADLFNWDAGSNVDDNFGTPENWNPDGVPGPDDLAVTNIFGPDVAIQITSDQSVDSFRISDGRDVNHTAGTLTITDNIGPDDGLWVGEFGGPNTYTFSGGNIILNDNVNSFDIGRNDGADGTFTMSGGTITNNGTGDAFFVGRFTGSTGTFNLSAGTINGPQAADTHIGLDGTATWNQSGGSFLAGGVHVGRFASPTATVDLSGSALWDVDLLLLADGSEGSGSAISADLTLTGGGLNINTFGLVIRDKGNLHYDGTGGISQIDLRLNQLLLGNAELFLMNLPSPNFFGEELVLINQISAYTGEATFDNAPNGATYGPWMLDYRPTQVVLVSTIPEPSTAAGALLLIGSLVLRRRR